MIVPITIKGKRYWIEFSVKAELWTPIPDITELRKLVLKNINVKKIYEDWEIAHEVRRTAISLLKRGVKPKRVVKEIQELYGIPEIHVFEVLEDLLFEVAESS